MKKAVLAALVAAASFQAVGSEYVNDGWYIGADVIGTSIKADEVDLSDSSTRAAISVGYDFKLADALMLGVEVEYADHGTFEFGSGVSMDVDSLSMYLKPKYFISNSPFYLGAAFGVGTYNAETEIKATTNSVYYGGYSYGTYQLTTTRTDSESETELVYGLETGYAFNSNLSLNAGYRITHLDFVDIKTWYAGLDYKF
ncbi:outer membrane beta-barrel protein [Vibrio sp. OCN044]|uniref:Outer membrane beta-barrel protein n=1 Tax=Vibrio tetraodonis subsp. pristinus TaxID=2695891 RepID=A0A6L8LNQ6_9VIBR|nr:outer membrane beta-barrel protein [Vibrio tetraodonis]MYM57654.1 outer membrane beta-barrel protein [Vibrio tetraodonis subsp. pristinus]